MLIFNLWALPVVMVIYLVLLGIEHFFPSLVAGAHLVWTLGIVTTTVGAAFAWVGVRGRLFLLPIWMIGIGIVCYQMGWQGTLTFLAILIAGAIFFFAKGKKKEMMDWNYAQLALLKAPVAPVDGTERQFWSWVESTLFLPIWMKITPELCQHNLVVLSALRNADFSFSKADSQRVDALAKFLEGARTAAKPVRGETKLQQPIEALVKKKVHRADARKAFKNEGFPPLFPASR